MIGKRDRIELALNVAIFMTASVPLNKSTHEVRQAASCQGDGLCFKFRSLIFFDGKSGAKTDGSFLSPCNDHAKDAETTSGL